jgi:pimeloyl-ACP methyl ester carboxylesterase
LGLAAAQGPSWQYDLRPGDHLTYRYTFQRETKTDENEEIVVNSRFNTHVLVAGATKAGISLGFQRNREAAELSRYMEKGKDRLSRELPDFQKRMQNRASRFSEAMEITPTGEPRYAWEMARETRSHVLDFVHEIMSLPPAPVAKGEVWHGRTRWLFDFRWVNDESVHNKLCHHIEAASPDGSLKISYWWSPESGVLEQLTLDGTYPDSGTTHETLRMELVSQVHGESLEHWLGAEETRQGALQALLLSPEVLVSTDQMLPVLASDDPPAQALTLAIASRRKLALPADTLDRLRRNASPMVKLSADAYDASNNREPLSDPCHHALPARPPAKFGTTLFTVPIGDSTAPYLLRVPLTYREDRPSPLLIYLEGGAGIGLDAPFSAENAVKDTNYLVLYPHAGAYWWSAEVTQRFDAVLKDVLQRFNVDRDRIYLTGFSNGGTGALWYATLWPHRFAAVVSLMGAGQCNDQVKAGLPNLANLPLFFIHGENDTRITPDCSSTTYDTLKESVSVVKPELKILPKHGHDLTLVSDNGLALDFLRNKVRNPFPHDVKLVMSDASATRNYWVEILDGKPGKSSLEARIKADNSGGNTLEIHSYNVKSLRLYLRRELLPKPGDVRIVWNGKTVSSGGVPETCSLPLPPSEGFSLDLADIRDIKLP